MQRYGVVVTVWCSTVMGRRWCSGSGERDAMQSSGNDPTRAGGQGIRPTERGGAQCGSVRAMHMQQVPRRSDGDATTPE